MGYICKQDFFGGVFVKLFLCEVALKKHFFQQNNKKNKKFYLFQIRHALIVNVFQRVEAGRWGMVGDIYHPEIKNPRVKCSEKLYIYVYTHIHIYTHIYTYHYK